MRLRRPSLVAAITAVVSLALVTTGLAPADAVSNGETFGDCLQAARDEAPGTPDSQIEGIDCSGFTDVTSLDGIQTFTDLRDLTATGAAGANGDLSPLAALTELEGLSLEHFGVTSVAALANKPRLSDLDLAHNGLSSFPSLATPGFVSLDLSDNDFSDASSIASYTPGSSSIHLEGNHLADITGVAGCEILDASGQTVTLGSATAGVPTDLPAVTDGNGDPADVVVDPSSAVAGTISGGTVTWATSGTGTLSWNSPFHSPCGASAQFDGTFTQPVKAGTVAKPTLTSVSPTSGPTAGGTSVTLTGTGLSGATRVTFGGDAATFAVESGTSITATSPAHAAGPFDVAVTTPGGTATDAAAFTFDAPAPAKPTVTSVTPSSGSTGGGTSVTIIGTGFTGATGVAFGSSDAASFSVQSDTSIVATSPVHGSGAVDVSVTTTAGTGSEASSFTFTAPAPAKPTITSIAPATGGTAGGTSVTITGTGFTGATGVTFGGADAASFSVTSDTSIVATSPAHAFGPVDVAVTTPGGTATDAGAFTFQAPAPTKPTITAVSPDHGPTGGGTTVTVTGTHLSDATGVTFGTTAAAFTVNSDSSITATSPAHASGPVDVSVTTPGGTGSDAGAFTFDAPAPAKPVITAVTPSNGPTAGGTSVTITGTGLSGTTEVTFGGDAATFSVQSDTTVTATSPAHGAGLVDITVTGPGGSGTAPAAYTYAAPATAKPRIRAITPSSGPVAGHTIVSITGSGFTGTTAVAFGATASAAFTVLSDTSLTVTSPAHTAGAVTVRVTTPTGSASVSRGFTYIPAPRITSSSTPAGPTIGGEPFKLFGYDFDGATSVTVGGMPVAFRLTHARGRGNPSYDEVLSFATPPAASAGRVRIVVTTPSGSASIGYRYFALPAPRITDSSNPVGPMAGGGAFEVFGDDFDGATSVTVGDTAVVFRLTHSSGRTSHGPYREVLTFKVPAAATTGRAKIVVTTPSGMDSINYRYR